MTLVVTLVVTKVTMQYQETLVKVLTMYCMRLMLPSSCFCAPAPACLAALRSALS